MVPESRIHGSHVMGVNIIGVIVKVRLRRSTVVADCMTVANNFYGGYQC
jgi:hypothetical protein